MHFSLPIRLHRTHQFTFLHKNSFPQRIRVLFPLFILIATVTLGVAGCNSSINNKNSLPTESVASFDSFLDAYFRDQMAGNTINLHYTLSDPDKYGITNVPISLGDISPSAVDASFEKTKTTLSLLNHFDDADLSIEQQLTYDVFSEYLHVQLLAEDLSLYDELLRPSTGIQSQLPVLYEEYRFYDKSDVENYLALISLTGDYFAQIIDFEQRKADAGLFMSDSACDNIISQCEDFILNPADHYLILSFNRKVEQLTDLSVEEKDAYTLKNATIVKKIVLPAYRTLANALTNLLGKGINNAGLCHFDKGQEYYEYLVYYNTGSSLTIPELQAMVDTQRTSDLTNSSALIAASDGLWEKCRNISLIKQDSVATLNTLQAEMLQQFPAPPKTVFTVRYIDECMEEHMAPAFYITAPIDNYTEHSIFINATTDTTTMRHFTTLAHEGFPGHLYQTVMSYEAGISPARSILNFPGYVEGWATYVEMLSYEYAGLEENVASLLSLNQSALLSLYASSDFGIHYDGWSFSDMVAFWSGYGISDQESLQDIYELIVAEPAHYLKYYIGYLEFLNLKETAKEKYGSSYNDVAFHRSVLSIGPAPFAILEKYLDIFYR